MANAKLEQVCILGMGRTDFFSSVLAHKGIHGESTGHRNVAFVFTLFTFCWQEKQANQVPHLGEDVITYLTSWT